MGDGVIGVAAGESFRLSDSVFVNGHYLIKGVAGAIFWKLVSDYAELGRTEFSNRVLRLGPAVRLPDVTGCHSDPACITGQKTDVRVSPVSDHPEARNTPHPTRHR